MAALDDNKTFELTVKDIKTLEGNILTVIDGMDLPPKQAEAIKSQLRRLVWSITRK